MLMKSEDHFFSLNLEFWPKSRGFSLILINGQIKMIFDEVVMFDPSYEKDLPSLPMQMEPARICLTELEALSIKKY